MTLGAIHVSQVPESEWPRRLPPPIGCNLSTNRKREPEWRRCVAASIAVGPSAILTGSRTRPSDWGWNRRFGPVEDRRNNRRLATVTGRCLLFFLLYSPNLVAVSFSSWAKWTIRVYFVPQSKWPLPRSLRASQPVDPRER